MCNLPSKDSISIYKDLTIYVMRQIRNKATMHRIIKNVSEKCVTERHEADLQSNDENYKTKLNWQILNIATLGFCNSTESFCKATW